MKWKVGIFHDGYFGCCGRSLLSGDEGLMIRSAELAHELDQMYDQLPGYTSLITDGGATYIGG
jgi:hypothetical protein